MAGLLGISRHFFVKDPRLDFKHCPSPTPARTTSLVNVKAVPQEIVSWSEQSEVTLEQGVEGRGCGTGVRGPSCQGRDDSGARADQDRGEKRCGNDEEGGEEGKICVVVVERWRLTEDFVAQQSLVYGVPTVGIIPSAFVVEDAGTCGKPHVIIGNTLWPKL